MVEFIVLLVFGLPIILVIYYLIRDSNFKKKSIKTRDELIQKNNILAYDWQSFSEGQILINDRTNRAFHFISGDSYSSVPEELITRVEIVIDDSVAYQSSISSAAGRAIVGGVLAGGVGAIIGGVTGKKKGSKVIHRMELIVSNKANSAKPFNRITLLEDKQGEDIFSDRYEDAYNKGLLWSRVIESYIKEN